jgi:xylulokinase
MYVIGMDLGTTNIKGLLFTRDGRQVGAASRATPTHYRGTDSADYDPEEIWRTVQTILSELVKGCPHPDAIAGLAFASFGESSLAVDGEGMPLAPAMAWFDSRVLGVLEEFRQRVDEREVFRITGMALTHIAGIGKLLWEQRYLPEVFRRMRYWLAVPSYLVRRLTGETRLDYSLASRTMLFDVHRRAWSERMCELAGVPIALLPPVAASGTPVGVIRKAVASALGLPANVVVSLGGHDHVCGALSVGIRRRGQMLNSSGTGDSLVVTLDPDQIDDRYFQAGVSCGCHVVPGLTYGLGGVRGSGRMIDWLRATFFAGTRDTGYEALVARAARAPAGSHGVVVAPHFQGAHIPQQDPMAKGAILGLRTGHTLDDLTRALFEALAFQLRLAVDTYAGLTGETFPDVLCIGGGSQNAFWVQMKADVLNRRIRVSALREHSAHGAALLAGIGAGLYRDAEEACALASPPLRDYVPHPAHVSVYGDIFDQIYCSLHPVLAGLDRKLEALQARLAEHAT